MKTIVLLVTALLINSLNCQVTNKIRYSRDSKGVNKPNYCKKGSCIKCVDKGEYFGCEKCINYGTKNKDIHKCDELTIRERESKYY